MKRLLPTLIVALLLCAPAAAQNALQGGHSGLTRQLEQGFKIVATERIASDDECYPDAEEIAAVLREKMGIEVAVVPDLNSVEGEDLVNVASAETECNRLVLAMRSSGSGKVFVLDSDFGPVYVQGSEGLSEGALAAAAGPLRELTAATSVFRMSTPDAIARFEVLCPEGTLPVGGGMANLTPLGEDGEGIYPHSYERLGVQNGFHVTPTLVDPSPESTRVRRGSLQVICGLGLVPTESPHETVFVQREGTGTVTARCPEGTELFSGGFQRTNFTTPGIVGYAGIMYGGNYITESRAVGTTAWRVSAGAVDEDGGELTAIAHCAEDPSLPLTEVSASGTVNDGESASVTTPRCPPGRALTAGGFSFNGSRDALFADGYFTRKGTWSATGYGWFGSAELTAYGYCLGAEDAVDRSLFPPEPAAPPESENDSGDDGDNVLFYVGLGIAALVLAGVLLRIRARRRQARRRARRR